MTNAAVITERAFTPLPANGKFDYQIGGAYTPDADVKVVTRDRTESPAQGKYNICYVNAFQTQPDEGSFWKTPERDHLLLRNSSGGYFIDPEWPDEIMLDTSTDENRQQIAMIINGWVSDCKQKGFNAIEADNLDTFSRSKELLTADNNLALAKLLTAYAHSIDMAFGQKNAGDIAARAKSEAGFDFAVVEQCQEFEECDTYTSVYGNQMLEIEYYNTDLPQNGLENFQSACAERGDQISIIFRDVEVKPPGGSGRVYQEC
ncbi:glycoside hydrolase family 114 protein [Marasmius fiardii PR-910]|nr:glycoside hydrolase family 114 protein [Marasmius fiardii PR-910]